jgi:superfamily II DNA or RNA helicase
MRQDRLERFPQDYYQTIIVDEAHHALSQSYQTIFKWFSEAKVLGVTATPDRGDKKNLGSFFQSLAFEYTLPAAIKDGYLCPIRAQTIPLQIDISQVKTTGGDYSEADLGKALEPYLAAIADEMVKACLDRKTLVFLPLIATSKRMRDLLVERGFRAGEVNGESVDRAEVLERFRRGETNCLCNSMLLTEGYDEPAIDCIVCLRPTKIRSLYAQIVGRGTRPSPGKEHLLLLDFLWNSERHELCRPAYLVAESEEVAKRMTEKINEAGDEGADLEAVQEEAQGELVNERELALAKQLAEMRHRKRALVDPLQYAVSIQAEDLVDYVPSFDWEMAPASKGQLQTLEKSGIFPEEITCAGQAAKLLERLNVRRASGFATPKQVRTLERFDYPHAGTMTFAEANKIISRLAANGWRKPN